MNMKQNNLVALVFFQSKTLSTFPAQQLDKVQTCIEDFVMFKHHFVKSVNWKVATGVSVFECGHRCVKSICLMTERGIFHGDDLDGMLGRKANINRFYRHNKLSLLRVIHGKKLNMVFVVEP